MTERLLPFKWDNVQRCLIATPMRPFQIKGLMLFDCPAGTNLSIIYVGNQPQLVVDVGPIPTEWFGHWKSYAMLTKEIEAGYEPPGWGTFDTTYPGIQVRIVFDFTVNPEAPPRALMWGRTIER